MSVRKMDSYEKQKKLGRHIIANRNDMLSDFTGLPVEVINALANIPMDKAIKALEMLPNADPSTWANAEKAISEHFVTDGEPFRVEDFSAIERMQVMKCKEASEICRLLYTAFPDILEMDDAILEEKAGIPDAALVAIRNLNIDWIERFDNIPNVRDPNPRLDPLMGLEDCKGVSREEAARLLWVSCADEVENSISSAPQA